MMYEDWLLSCWIETCLASNHYFPEYLFAQCFQTLVPRQHNKIMLIVQQASGL